jgi:hypothetical protein
VRHHPNPATGRLNFVTVHSGGFLARLAGGRGRWSGRRVRRVAARRAGRAGRRRAWAPSPAPRRTSPPRCPRPAPRCPRPGHRSARLGAAPREGDEIAVSTPETGPWAIEAAICSPFAGPGPSRLRSYLPPARRNRPDQGFRKQPRDRIAASTRRTPETECKSQSRRRKPAPGPSRLRFALLAAGRARRGRDPIPRPAAGRPPGLAPAPPVPRPAARPPRRSPGYGGPSRRRAGVARRAGAGGRLFPGASSPPVDDHEIGPVRVTQSVQGASKLLPVFGWGSYGRSRDPNARTARRPKHSELRRLRPGR